MTSPTAKAFSALEARRAANTAFVTAITTLCAADKGAQAALRSGLGRPVEKCARLHRYVVIRIAEGMRPTEERAFYAIAALIAARPRAARDADAQQSPELESDAPEPEIARADEPPPRRPRPPSLGTSLGQAVAETKMKEESAEKLLHQLTRQSADTVHTRLPRVIDQVLGAGITVDFPTLLDDLRRWELGRDQVAKRWLQDFYRAMHTNTTQNPDESGPS